jgi:hypothetical protein
VKDKSQVNDDVISIMTHAASSIPIAVIFVQQADNPFGLENKGGSYHV